ncbi:MAG TPA: MarR family transcriptional regulator [Candidatus Limnocylindrales bacterium]
MDPKRPDRANIEDALSGYRQLAQMLAGSRLPELPDSSVTMAQMRVLMLLVTIGPTHMSELAGALRISLSTLSGLVDRLVESGLVSRHTDDHDRRQVIVSLSADGVQFLDYFQEVGVSHLRELLLRLSPDEVRSVTTTLDLLMSAAHELPTEEPR